MITSENVEASLRFSPSVALTANIVGSVRSLRCRPKETCASTCFSRKWLGHARKHRSSNGTAIGSFSLGNPAMGTCHWLEVQGLPRTRLHQGRSLRQAVHQSTTTSAASQGGDIELSSVASPAIAGKVTGLPRNRTALDFSVVTAFAEGFSGLEPIGGAVLNAVGPDGALRSEDLHPGLSPPMQHVTPA